MFKRAVPETVADHIVRPGWFFYLTVLGCVALLTSLGVWQLERLAWKTNLIATVDARVERPAQVAPGPSAWTTINKSNDEYRHVFICGVFLHNLETLVRASTIEGPGYWVLTPLRTDSGETYLVNRGFVPFERQLPATRADGQISGVVTVTGLLRLTEPRGSFIQTNQPDLDLWYSRDVAAIAKERHLTVFAPFFIDADKSENAGGFPVGGLTVVHFENHHLQYALTWFVLDVMCVCYSFAARRKLEVPRA